jgi:serine protease Do
MRAGTAVGVVAGILGIAAVVTLGAQAQAQAQAKPSTAPSAGQKVVKEVVVEQRPGGETVVTERQGDGQPKIIARQGGGPLGGGMYRPAIAGGPRLGIEIRDVTKDDVAAMKLPGQQGVVVTAVTKESAAEKAGLKAGDVVVAYDGETVRSAQQLTRLVGETAPGRAVKIALVRDGKRTDLEATPDRSVGDSVSVSVNPDQIRGEVERQLQGLRDQLSEYRLQRRVPLPSDEGLRFKMEGPPTGERFQWFGQEGGPFEMYVAPSRGRLGVTVQELTPELAAYFGVKDGVLVASVTADSPAAKAGIKAGDVITTVDDKPITSAAEITVLLAVKTGEVPIGLTRDKKALTLKATIEAPKTPGRRVVLRGSPA